MLVAFSAIVGSPPGAVAALVRAIAASRNDLKAVKSGIALTCTTDAVNRACRPWTRRPSTVRSQPLDSSAEFTVRRSLPTMLVVTKRYFGSVGLILLRLIR